MALICIKIGENEPSTYSRYYQLYKHMDVVDVIIGKTSPGVMAEKEYLVLNVDTSKLRSDEIKHFKSLCKEDKRELLGYITDAELGEQKPLYHTTERRKHRLNIEALDWLSATTKNIIADKANHKRQIKVNLYQYQSDNGLTTGLDKIRLISNIKDEYQRRVKITGTGDLNVGSIDKLSDEGVANIIDRITRQHLSKKLSEFSQTFDMSDVNKLRKIISYETFMASIIEK